MAVESDLLPRLLIAAGLMAATIEYAEILRRRAAARRLDAEHDAASAAGLRGLVRVFLAEPERR